MQTVSHKEALYMIDKEFDVSSISVDFQNQKVNAQDAMLLGEHGHLVPIHLVEYDYENINFSDHPEATEEELKYAVRANQRKIKLALSVEIEKWIEKENIDINALASDLITNFYTNLKSHLK